MDDLIKLDEGSNEFKILKEMWHVKARGMTLEKLPTFLKELSEKYQHDYGTICHAIATAAVASAWAVESTPQGGITGFQAGAIMWEFIRQWNFSNNKTGLCIIDYDNFLYPQYEDKFQKVIPQDVWASIQHEAKNKIEKANKEFSEYKIKHEQYEKDITVFVKKYPDYYDNRKHYDPLGMGTGEQWKAENKKKKSGFEFAPQEPHRPVYIGDRVYEHWVSIVMGEIPFGYSVKS